MPTRQACDLLGLSRASVYRARTPLACGPRRAPSPGSRPTALDTIERAAVLAVLDSTRFVDKAPAQVWAILLDEGICLGSVSTFYRVLRGHGQVRERRAQATHPARVRPELMATGPNQVRSWDITKAKGPCRGTYFDTYAMLDIFSRKTIHWEVHITETGEIARDFIDHSIAINDGAVPDTIHSDNGTSMTSKNVAALLSDLHIQRSLSRPHVSNDSPYSEALFKTIKYCPVFPENFTSVYDARVFMKTFFEYYNTEHRHSGIGFYTPASVHDGTWKNIRDNRQLVLDSAYEAHPERFCQGRPTAPDLPTKAWINRPPTTIETDTDPRTHPTPKVSHQP